MSKAPTRALAVQQASMLRALAERIEEEDTPLPPEVAAPLAAQLLVLGTNVSAELTEGEVSSLLASVAEADRGELVPLAEILPP
jgi:hypothetical protein